MDTRTPPERDLQSYEQEWNRQLSPGAGRVFIGILAAIAVFIFLGVLPWALSYMQDTGMIKPKLQLRFGEQTRMQEQSAADDQEGQPEVVQPRQSSARPFGMPRRVNVDR